MITFWELTLIIERVFQVDGDVEECHQDHIQQRADEQSKGEAGGVVVIAGPGLDQKTTMLL